MQALQDATNYILFSNPVSSGLGSVLKKSTGVVGSLVPQRVEYRTAPPAQLWTLASHAGPYIRIAALSGAVAVGLGAYGAHRKYKCDEHMNAYKTASMYHFIHTLALLGAPLCRARFFTCLFMVSGITMFSGSCYYYAFTGEKKYSMVTPYGGVCFILGWLTMLV